MESKWVQNQAKSYQVISDIPVSIRLNCSALFTHEHNSSHRLGVRVYSPDAYGTLWKLKTWFVIHYLIPKFAKSCFVGVFKKPTFLYQHTLGAITNLRLHKKYRNIAGIIDFENASKFHNTYDTMILKRKSEKPYSYVPEIFF